MKWFMQSFINDALDGLTYTISDEKGILAEGLTKEQAENLYYSHMDNPRDCECESEYPYDCGCDCGCE